MKAPPPGDHFLTYLINKLFVPSGSGPGTPSSSQKDSSHSKTPKVSPLVLLWLMNPVCPAEGELMEGCFLCAELPPACEGDLCVVSEDCLSSGEAGGQQGRVPQLMLPLLTLQHQTEVKTPRTE